MKEESLENDKQKKSRKPRSKDQAVKCEFCPKTFSALRWNTGEPSRKE